MCFGSASRTRREQPIHPNISRIDFDLTELENFKVGRDVPNQWLISTQVAAYENSAAPGYATEKLFQVLAEGSVPVYWGAPDARALLPAPAAAVMVDDFEGPALEPRGNQISLAQ